MLRQHAGHEHAHQGAALGRAGHEGRLWVGVLQVQQDGQGLVDNCALVREGGHLPARVQRKNLGGLVSACMYNSNARSVLCYPLENATSVFPQGGEAH